MLRVNQFFKDMAGESNPGFHHHLPYQQGSSILYKSNSSSGGGYELISMGNYYGNTPNVANDGTAPGIQNFSSGAAPQINSMGSSSTLVLDSVAGLKHDTGLAVVWSVEEQYKLEEGLTKYANEPNIMRYIKIAASLDKTVRDVALRCRWMTRKRRKQDNQYLGKKIKDGKDKLESFLKNNIASASSVNLPAYSHTTNHEQSDCMLSGALSWTVRHLLDENNHAFGQISTNLSTLKLQENIDLFVRARNNLTTILNDMRNMPGIMCRMPPLPVLLNEELASNIVPRSSQPMMFGSSSLMPLKQEPGC